MRMRPGSTFSCGRTRTRSRWKSRITAEASRQPRCAAPSRWDFWECANACCFFPASLTSMGVVAGAHRRRCRFRCARSRMRGFPMKILIADDHPVVRHGLKQMLTGEPDMLVVGEAKNGNEAMELARKLEWDVAILDYSMPGRSGLQLLGEIKREFPQRPVLILSMHPEELHARRVLKAGGAGYMNKESAGEELAAAIRQVVGGGKDVSASLAQRLAVELGAHGPKPPAPTPSDLQHPGLWPVGFRQPNQ